MKIINSKTVKSTITYTWWIYILLPILLSVLFYWTFNLYHKPTVFEKVSIFTACEVVDHSFTDKIKEKINDPTLREVGVSSSKPSDARYEEKVSVVGLNNCDLLILPEDTIKNIGEPNEYFVALDDELKTYSSSYYITNDVAFGYNITNSDFASKYLKLDENVNYYLMINLASRNAGKYYEEGNKNDHALSVCKAILEGI